MAGKKSTSNNSKSAKTAVSKGSKWSTAGSMKPVDLSKIEFVNRPKKSK